MKCFNHHQEDAVGICKHCSKGVCSTCTMLVGGSVACAASCTEAVARIDALIRSNTAASEINQRRGGRYFQPAFLGGMGLLFILLPVFEGYSGRGLAVAGSMGAAFLIFGIVLGLYQRAWARRSRAGA
jgi:hypothetical protein